MMGHVAKLVLCLTLGLCLDFGSAKPASSDSPSTSLQIPSPDSSSARRVLSSWNIGDGSWSGSTRLPSSSTSGGGPEGLSSKKDLTATATIDNGRSNRRLHKWGKTSAEQNAQLQNEPQNLADESLESSSERDVFIQNNDTGENENSASEEGDEGVVPTHDPTLDDDGQEDDDDMVDKQKSDHGTTPKGLTTWSAVAGSYVKGQAQPQKVIPQDFTVSGGLLSFNNDPTTPLAATQTTELPRTTKSNLALAFLNTLQTTTATSSSAKRRKPYHKNKKIVAPSKFVKPPLEDITAEAIGTDATHTIYKTKTQDEYTKNALPPMTKTQPPYPPKRPQWPYQLPPPVKKVTVVTTKRPAAFSRITSKPKPKKPTALAAAQTPTTTTPHSTTVYNRNPPPMMYPFPSISFTNLSFMDFLRSQIVPRIGLSLISFMAASPLILSMLGASAVGRRRRRRRSLNLKSDSRQAAIFENLGSINFEQPHFDFSAIKKKLEERIGKSDGSDFGGNLNSNSGLVTKLKEMLDKIVYTNGFKMLRDKFLKRDSEKKKF